MEGRRYVGHLCLAVNLSVLRTAEVRGFLS